MLRYDAVFHAGSIRGALRQRRWFYVGLAGTWIVLGLFIASGPRWRSAGFQSGLSPWTDLLNQPAMILTYLRLAVWPDPLVLDYGITHPIALRDALGPSLAVVAFLVVSALAGALVLSNRPSEALAVLEEARRRHPADQEIEAAYADLTRGLTRSGR